MAGSKSKNRRRKKTTNRPNTVHGGKQEIDANMAGCDESCESLQREFDAIEIESAVSMRSPLLLPEGYADLAVHCYKKIRGPEHTDYEVLQPLGCRRILAIVPEVQELGVLDWCHVSFIARSRKSDSNEVLFFAELVDFGYGDGLVLNNFSILKRDSPEITNGCGFCPPNVGYPHPHDAYFAGDWEYAPSDDASQKRNAILFAQNVMNNQNSKLTPKFDLKRGLLFRPEPFEELVIDPSLRSPQLSDFEYAELALECFKKEHGTVGANYQIVKPLGSYRFLSHVPSAEIYEVIDWCHVSFIAKPKNSDCNDDTVLFFVELADFSYGDQLALNYFSISKPDADVITYGCGFCPHDEDHRHLPGAYFAGIGDHKPTSAISQAEMAVCFQRQVISKRKGTNLNQHSRPYLWPELVKRHPSCFSPLLSEQEYAVLALTHISKAEGAEYKLLDTIYSHRQRCIVGMSGYGHWCHVCFIARPKKANVPPVHFFAELNDPGVGKFSLSVYSRMDPRGVGTAKGCGICPISENYPHPATLPYIAGSWPHNRCFLRDNYLRCSHCIKIEEMKNPEFFSNCQD